MNFYPALRVPRQQPQRTDLDAFTPERTQASIADDASIVSGNTTRSTRWTPEGDSAGQKAAGRFSYYPALKLNSIPKRVAESPVEVEKQPAPAPSGFTAPSSREGSSFAAPSWKEPTGFTAPASREGSSFTAPSRKEPSGFTAPASREGSSFAAPSWKESSGFTAPASREGSGFTAPSRKEPSGFTATALKESSGFTATALKDAAWASYTNGGIALPFQAPEAALGGRGLLESNAIETSTTATAQSSGLDTAGYSDRCLDGQPAYSPVNAGTFADSDGLGFVESPRDASNGHTIPRSCMAATSSSAPAANSRDRVAFAAPTATSAASGEVEVRGLKPVPAAWSAWTDVRFPPRLLDPLQKAGFPAPTTIQQTAWPILAQGSDLIGIAKTGSGKTLAFLLPAFARLIETHADPRGPPAILVLAPTRELAVQIEAQATSFGGPAGMKATCLYGGAPKGPQLAQLRMRPQVLVATPGRLNDLLDPAPGLTLAVDVKNVKFLVLDEADRMLDMGFEPQIRKIISFLPKERQTMMFTATWPATVRQLSAEFLRDPMEIRIGDADALTVNPDIEQHVVFCTDALDKDRRLEELLREAGEDQTIVFASTKRTCDLVAYRTTGSVAIHGDKDQQARDAALGAFKSGARKVLVATDVAARGLDIKAVRLVINYDPPPREEDYVHRVGRTGRAGMKGKAVSLLTNEDSAAAKSIAEVLKRGGLPVPEELSRRLASGEMRSGRDPSRPRARPGFSNPTPTFIGGGGGGLPRGGGSFGGSKGGFTFGADDFDFGGFGSRTRDRMDDLPTSYNDCPTW